jgi:hypothetical protein
MGALSSRAQESFRTYLGDEGGEASLEHYFSPSPIGAFRFDQNLTC